MRLIDADRLILEYDCYEREWLRIRADRIDTVTVEAIPIEWIKKWCGNEPYWSNLAMHLIEDWEKENETNVEC